MKGHTFLPITDHLVMAITPWALLLFQDSHVPAYFIFSKPSHLCAKIQSTLIQIFTCFNHWRKYQVLQPLTGIQSVEHNPRT